MWSSMLLIILFCLAQQRFCLTLQGGGPEFLETILKTWWVPYLDVEPLVTFNYNTNVSNVDVLRSFATESTVYDFGCIDPYDHIPDDSWGHPNYLLFPILVDTLVPMVNVPGIEHSALVLTRQAVAQIFMGNVTNWNDSIIKQTNQNLPLPNANITVFYLKNDSHNGFWSEALSAFSSEWNETYHTFISWPIELRNLPNFIGVDSDIDLQAEITLTPYSIGYLSPSRTARVNLPYARLINRHGNTVDINAESDSVVDVDVDENLKAPHGIDSSDTYAWPLGTYIYFVVPKKFENGDCKRARENFLWIHWLLDNSLGRTLAAVDGYGFLKDELHRKVIPALRSIKCKNVSVLAYEDHEPYAQHLNSFLGVTVVLLTLSLAMATVHIWSFRTSKINLIYSSVFLVGIILTLVSPIFWYLPAESTAVCQARIWTMSLGFATLLGTMFSRTWQLREIYLLQKKAFDQLRHNVSIKSSLMKLLITISVVIGIDVFILGLWSGLDPYTASFIVRDELNLIGDWSCGSKHLKYWLSSQIIYMFFLIAFGVYVIYQTWSFQKKVLVVETRWVLLALYNIILNLMALAPFLSIHTPLEGFLCLLVIISIDFSATGIICAVLLPRIIQKLDWSRTDDDIKKGGGTTLDTGTTGQKSPTKGSKGSKKMLKAEYSKTPEDRLAEKLSNPQPLKIEVRRSNKYKILPAPTRTTSEEGIELQTLEEHRRAKTPSPIRESRMESISARVLAKHDDVSELAILNPILDVSSSGALEVDPLTGAKMTWSTNPIQDL